MNTIEKCRNWAPEQIDHKQVDSSDDFIDGSVDTDDNVVGDSANDDDVPKQM